MAKILIVEDDPCVAEAIMDSLEDSPHTLEWVPDGREGLERLKIYQYDLAVLDWSLPLLTGPEICRSFRIAGGKIPILMLTGHSAEEAKVEGLDAGADDYLTKPFSMKELQARVRALLRRPAQTLGTQLVVGDLLADPATCKVTRAGKQIDLLPKEMAVLEYLMRHQGQTFSVVDLLNGVWSSESDSSQDAVRKCIERLRKKLEINGKESPIKTVKGLGYRVEPTD